MEIPIWFGIEQFNIVIYTIWFGLVCWIIVNYIRLKESNLGIKSKLISIKDWWNKFRARKEI